MHYEPTIRLGKHKLGRGYDAARTFLHENKPILNELLKDIRNALQNGPASALQSQRDCKAALFLQTIVHFIHLCIMALVLFAAAFGS